MRRGLLLSAASRTRSGVPPRRAKMCASGITELVFHNRRFFEGEFRMSILSIGTRRSALLSLALALAAPSLGVAQVAGDSATITGTVTNEGGVPIGNARVTLLSLQLSATTNDAGTYRLIIPAARFVAG